jgi:hypothetical protein
MIQDVCGQIDRCFTLGQCGKPGDDLVACNQVGGQMGRVSPRIIHSNPDLQRGDRDWTQEVRCQAPNMLETQ